ncbi:hypothetical protein B0H16DRAFT_1694631 [Mycena metata]|uniref:MYND-type domain-containing protein n=1 Tax=Mycena metata TaxID=1033252 RepID=A0AAD7MYS2_9AGAR|nr:hypothetical protein B0H16DRAFT_1694631 [Mycena metata]
MEYLGITLAFRPKARASVPEIAARLESLVQLGIAAAEQSFESFRIHNSPPLTTDDFLDDLRNGPAETGPKAKAVLIMIKLLMLGQFLLFASTSAPKMHDCLHLRNLSKLKTAGMRSSARAAAAGSLPDLVALCDSLGDLPEMQALLTLPALFANVDRQRIPNSAELDTLLSREMPVPHVDCAFQALMGFGVLAAAESIPLSTAADLWPHLWRWLDFLHTHWDYLPASRFVDQRRVCMHHAAIILALSNAHDTSTIIRATPGVRRLLATAWKGMIGDDALFACGAAGTLDLVLDIVSLLVDRKISASHFEEVVDGVGGTIQDLASTIIRHFSRAVPHPELKITAKFVVVCFGFLHSGCAGSPQLRRALCSMDFFTPLINTLTALQGTTALEAPWMRLNHLVGMLEGSAEIASALKSGLLRLTVAIAALIAPIDRNEANKTSLLIIQILQRLLPQSLVHYTVLVQLKKCFPSCLAFATASKIEVSAFSQDWRDFSTLAQKRLQFLDSWEARTIPSLKACDNTECGKIDVRRKFMCCSRCRSVVKVNKPHWRTYRKGCVVKYRMQPVHEGQRRKIMKDVLVNAAEDDIPDDGGVEIDSDEEYRA